MSSATSTRSPAGPSGRRWPRGWSSSAAGHAVHVDHPAVPGYPVDDEEYHGVFIHRWIRTGRPGPLFALSFVAGVIRALRRLRSELDVVHTHQGLWEAVATGLARPLAAGRPDARAAGQLGLLRRGRRAAPDARIGLAPADHPAATRPSRRSRPRSSAQWRDLGVPAGGSSGWPAASTPSISAPARAPSSDASCPARASSSPAGSTPRRTSRSCSKPGPTSPDGRRRT